MRHETAEALFFSHEVSKRSPAVNKPQWK